MTNDVELSAKLINERTFRCQPQNLMEITLILKGITQILFRIRTMRAITDKISVIHYGSRQSSLRIKHSQLPHGFLGCNFENSVHIYTYFILVQG